MISTTTRALALLMVLPLLLTMSSGVDAQAPASSTAPPTFDHLNCFIIKDTLGKKVYRADLPAEQTPFSEKGCAVLLPAKWFCVDVEKTNVKPQPPLQGQVAGQKERDFLCYSLKCPTAVPARPVEDQFGKREIALGPADHLCVPANKVPK